MNRYAKSLLINLLVIVIAIFLLFYVDFGHYAYLAGNLLMAGTAFIHLWLKDAKLFNRQQRIFVYLIILSVVLIFIEEPIALKWGIYGYNSDKTMGVIIGPVFESISFAILIFLAIGGAVLRLCNQIDRKRDVSIW